MRTRDEIVKEIASEIVGNKNYSNIDWESVSVVICFDSPSIFESGILYNKADYISKIQKIGI